MSDEKCPNCGSSKTYTVPRSLTCTKCHRSWDADETEEAAGLRAQLAQAKTRYAELATILLCDPGESLETPEAHHAAVRDMAQDARKAFDKLKVLRDDGRGEGE